MADRHAALNFRVTDALYDQQNQRLHFTASGNRGEVKFTVVTSVTCTRDPGTPERQHLVAMVKITELFNRPSASGR